MALVNTQITHKKLIATIILRVEILNKKQDQANTFAKIEKKWYCT